MLYIIPAWYTENKWRENEQKWYRPRSQTEMDDTVKQIQLFARQPISEYRILLLSFAPNFRHFLHRQSVFHAPYWSVFDAIQCISRKHQRVFSFHDMSWPEGIEFVYSHFAVAAMLDGEKYAQIEFGEDGNLILIDLYQNGRLSRRNRYDDRGFIGSTEVFDDGQTAYEYFMDEEGTWKLCLFADGHVVVNAQSPYYLLECAGELRERPFEREAYDSIDEVIREVLAVYLEGAQKQDIFCVAMHERHCGVLSEVLQGRNTILSFWGSRGLPSATPSVNSLVRQARYIVADVKEGLAAISSKYGEFSGQMAEITPYDSRIDLGISRQTKEQRILVPVDDISDEVFRDIVVVTARYVRTNANARVHLFTRSARFEKKDELLGEVRRILESEGLDVAAVLEERLDQLDDLETDLQAQPPLQLFAVDQCVDELSVSKCLKTQYLLVDLAPTPDLFLQIGCISMCIPQVVRSVTRYVEDGGNGMVISRTDQLDWCLHHYLDSLNNWNAAMVRSYEMGQRFTTAGLVDRWKEVLSNSGCD